jgi:hypothetical protein
MLQEPTLDSAFSITAIRYYSQTYVLFARDRILKHIDRLITIGPTLALFLQHMYIMRPIDPKVNPFSVVFTQRKVL